MGDPAPRAAPHRASVGVRLVDPSDAAAVAAIYNHYVLNTPISFEEAEVSADELRNRIEKVSAASLPWLVAEHDGKLIGYAYATQWRERKAYRHTVECSVYVAQDQGGHGVGSQLYARLFPALKACGCHVVIAGIALPNEASVKLHERFGMRKVAHYAQVGRKFGRWHDVGHWQLIL